MQLPTVLIVEDEPEICSSLAWLVRCAGFAVATAENGRQALDYLQQHLHDLPALIVLDLTMPVMNGWEFRSVQVRDTRFAHIPVIVCSALIDPCASKDFAGIKAFHGKPVEPTELIRDIRTFCKPDQLVRNGHLPG